jgi:chemotaxis protein methyltransferase CheR
MDNRAQIYMPDDAFRLLRDLISDYCGVYYDNDSKYILESRLNRRLQVHGIDDFRDYYRYLLYNKEREAELAEIIDILTVNETYFFREKRQFDALLQEIVPEIKSSRSINRKLKIWSAGCASGEEPYTIAMLVLENPSVFGDWDVEIYGSDINKRVLQKARKGVFSKNSFRSTDNYYIKKYFDEDGDGMRIKDKVRELVDFSNLNLLEEKKFNFLEDLDAIFCRNVLIYFHAGAKKKVIENYYNKLCGGGYLLLGHAESLMNISSSFALKHLKHDMVYQKPRTPDMNISNESLYRMVWG